MKYILETEQSGLKSTTSPGSRCAVNITATSSIPAYNRNNHVTSATAPNKKSYQRAVHEVVAQQILPASHSFSQEGTVSILFKRKSRLPSGFGSIRFLGRARTKPFAVHPPMKESQEGEWFRPPALCYVPDRETGFKVLCLYHAGMFDFNIEKNRFSLDKHVLEMMSGLGMVSGKMPVKIILEEKSMPETNADQTISENSESIEHCRMDGQDKTLNDPVRIETVYCSILTLLQRIHLRYSDNNRMEKDRPDFGPNVTELADKESESCILRWDIYGADTSSEKNTVSSSPYSFTEKPKDNTPAELVNTIEKEGSGFTLYDTDILRSLYDCCGQILKRIDRNESVSYPDESTEKNIDKSIDTKQKCVMPVLKEVYEAFYQYKYGSYAARPLSDSSRNAAAAAYRKLEPFYNYSLDEISITEWQNLVNDAAAHGYSKSAVSDLVTLIRQLYRFAYPREMCKNEYGKYIVLPYTVQEVHHQDFTDEELQILWANKENPVVSMILIMCYSGFRINEYAPENGMQTVISQDGKSGYFRGGMKTKAGKDRIVPIHSAILPLVKQTMDKNGKAVYLCGMSSNRFRKEMKIVLREIGIDAHFPNVDCKGNLVWRNMDSDAASSPSIQEVVRYHTPHSCRHTFSRLCESYGVNEADRKRMLGHSFGNDITNGVYGHRSLEELSAEIEKIKIVCG